jgi:hypothetical protein
MQWQGTAVFLGLDLANSWLEPNSQGYDFGYGEGLLE